MTAQAVEAAVKVGKAIGADIPEETTFHRKNYYYYPDLPKNFQITQYEEPVCQDGELEFSVEGDDGERGAINFPVGQVMQKTGGSADPGDVNQLLREEPDA